MELYELLEHIVRTFERLEIPYLITGSVASMAYGEPRLTNDIDLVAAVEGRHVPALLEAFPSPTFYLSEEGMREAIRFQRQFNIIHPGSGLKVDVVVRKDTPFDRSRFTRIRSLRPTEHYAAAFASPEDVIIKKMEYYQWSITRPAGPTSISAILPACSPSADRRSIRPMLPSGPIASACAGFGT